jgi:acetylornithine deacetylase/succinyl-diaminopimelate desuccinylase-like protein
MKAANAAYLGAVAAAIRAGLALRGDVVVATVCGELMGGAGTRHALRSGLRADYFVLGEPSELELGLRHGAAFLYRVHVRGRMKHYSTVPTPGQAGVHAVEKMVAVLQALGPSHRPLAPPDDGGWVTFVRQPGFEPLPQLNVGSIRGGISREYNASRPALFPDWCTILLDVRAVPGMTVESVRADLDRLLARLAADDPDFRYEIEVPAAGLHRAVRRRSPVAGRPGGAGRSPPGDGTAGGRQPQPPHSCLGCELAGPRGDPGRDLRPRRQVPEPPGRAGPRRGHRHAARVYAVMIADLCTRPRTESR